MEKVRNKRRSHAEMSLLSISALYSKQRDPETLRAARRLRMTNKMSSRSVSTPVIPQCLYAGYRSFLLRPILRIQTLRNDEAAGVRGFTLVELLVVVLIIGILSAIAIPMYQGAVDKSHWSTMLPASKAIKDAEEAFKMTNGEYSDTMEHLDVQISNDDLTFTLNTPNNLSQPNVIKVTNSKLGDQVRLASYLDASPLFAGQLHCEAKNEGSTPNERGQRLCEKLLNGQELNTAGGYTRYLLDQSIDKATCGEIGRAWSSNKSGCYKTKEERCRANVGTTWNNETQTCTYVGKNTQDNITLEEGEVCQSKGNTCNNIVVHAGGRCQAYPAAASTCDNSKFLDGAVCQGTGGEACKGGNFTNGSICLYGGDVGATCRGGTFDNSLCISGGFYGGCGGSTFSNDSVCYAKEGVYVNYGCTTGTYNDTSCCCGGSSCPNKYRCSDTRCAQVEQQVAAIEAQYR